MPDNGVHLQRKSGKKSRETAKVKVTTSTSDQCYLKIAFSISVTK